MKKIAIFYHTVLSINPEYALEVLHEQTRLLGQSGLHDACDQFIIGVNGAEEEAERIRAGVGPKAQVVAHPPEKWSSGECPTLQYLGEWVLGFPDHYVLYLHMKGVTHARNSPGHRMWKEWRHAMQDVCVRQWPRCVAWLDNGYESVGTRWMDQSNGSYWAGNFWWAKASFLATLPPIKPEGHLQGGRFEAEVWIGKGPRLPRRKNL